MNSLRPRWMLLALAMACTLAACKQHQNGNGAMMLVGVDQDIAAEAKGEPVQPADKSWQEHWTKSLSYIQSPEYRDESLGPHNLWVKYIVACRRAAGLPDLPNYPSLGVAAPPRGCNASGTIAHASQ